MVIELDHAIVPSHNRDASAKHLAELLGVRCGPAKEDPFCAVYANDGLTLNFIQSDEEFPIYHFCFRADDERFSQILSGIQKAGIQFRSSVRSGADMKINTDYSGRMIYWNEPDNHQWEILTVSYAHEQSSQLTIDLLEPCFALP